MASQTVILIERKGRTHFTRFIELFKNRAEIPMREVRSSIPKSTFYDFILGKIYALNQTIKNIDPSLEPFISMTLENTNGRIVQTFKRNCNIEIIDEDPNFFYLRLKTNIEDSDAG